MMKVNGKHPILGPLAPYGAIDFIFGTVDYIRASGVRLHTPKIVGSPRHRGEISCSKVFLFFSFLVFDFLPSSGEQIFGSIVVVFAPNGVFQRGLIS